ncbi:hypothetical protein KVR01_008831 [Diaporthe batatas]|uniref:uncharacterized protein n=1 Tax=Diaporthe batatas TaxID=748121 RepID=UPI001D03E25F|nr:uncharacterized protein KVR01_008831 [Diaporthe batatas]KAG8161844.1 hypothetical protein KVR01_008831 [Diaporthe batatas]
MSLARSLRGSCACNRNQYLIKAPQDAREVAQVHFGTEASHRLAQASLLSAHLRIPLNWFYSATVAYFPDETANTIRRVYESPAENHARRQFCGYCGTPLTFWTEQPHGEGDYIHVTLGSLCRDDLGDLDELGLIPESPSSEERGGAGAGGGSSELSARGGGGGGGGPLEAAQQASEAQRISAALSTAAQPIGRESRGIPWIESLVEGSSLGGRLKRASVTRRSADGSAWAQWHIIEYSDDGHDQVESSEHDGPPSGNNGKRKLADRDDVQQ